MASARRPEPRRLVQNRPLLPKGCSRRPHSLLSPAPFLCSRSCRRCRYPLLCSLFILAPRKMTMLLGTSLVVTQPCRKTEGSAGGQPRTCSSLRRPYHDGVGEVAVGLALQPHGAELRGHVAIGGGLVKGGLPDASHFRGHKEGQHALGSRKDIQVSTVWMKVEERPAWWGFGNPGLFTTWPRGGARASAEAAS